jgi:hypothetical protein
MVDARQKIRAGLDKHDAAQKGLKRPRLAHLSGRRTDIPNLKLLNNSIRQKHSKLASIKSATTSAIAEQGAAIRARYEAEGWAPGEKEGHRVDVLGNTKRKTLTDRALVAMEKEIAALVADDVSDLLAGLRADHEAVTLAREAWSNHVTVLMRKTLASPERQICTANMANAGPVELLDYAKEAIRENDLAKGAAVLSRVDRLPGSMKKSLEFTKADVAEALVEEEFQGAVELLALSEFSLLVAGHDGREALGHKLNEGDTLARGVKRSEIEVEIGRELVEADLAFKPVVGGKEVKNESDVVADAEKKAATDRAEAFAKWNATEIMSDEWFTLGRAGGWVEDENEGNENNGTE